MRDEPLRLRTSLIALDATPAAMMRDVRRRAAQSLIARPVRRCCARRRGVRRCRRRAPVAGRPRAGRAIRWGSAAGTRTPGRRRGDGGSGAVGFGTGRRRAAATTRRTPGWQRRGDRRDRRLGVVAERRGARSELGHDPARLIRPVGEQPPRVRLGEHHPQQIALVVGQPIDRRIQQRLRSVPCEEVPPRPEHVRRCTVPST